MTEHRNRNRKKILGSSAIFLPPEIQKANSDRMVPNYTDQQNKEHGCIVQLSDRFTSMFVFPRSKIQTPKFVLLTLENVLDQKKTQLPKKDAALASPSHLVYWMAVC